MHISLFGGLHIDVPGLPISAVMTPRLQSLLAWLILYGGKPQPRERIAGLLWPESSESQARTNLRQLLHHLKRALPSASDLLIGDHFSVSWQRTDSCSIDVVEFEGALARAAQANKKEDVDVEVEELRQAVRLYVDDLMPSIYDSWILSIRLELRDRLSTALRRLAFLMQQQGQFQAAILAAERLVVHDSLRESNYQLLMQLHAANQDRASGLRIYHQLKTALRRELGVSPTPETMMLFEEALKGGSSVLERSALPNPERSNTGSFVGRREEVRRIESAWTKVIRGATQAIIISGEPGIGKTRVAEELINLAESNGNPIARARCYSGRGQVAYSPIAEWLRSDALKAVWAKMSSSQLAEVARLLPEAGEGYPISDEPPLSAEGWQKFKLYQSLAAAFAASTRPLLLFMDDLQWCDVDSFDWIRHLLSSQSALGLLFLGTVRAEETGRNHPFTIFLTELRRAGVAVEIPLPPLDAAEVTELAGQESVRPILEGELTEIVRSTQGNPLFVLETVRAGAQSARIQAVISARLASLTAASYELAGVASIVGRPFSFELLEKTLDWDERSLLDSLDELWQRRIIEARGGSGYDFTHERLREVARQELSLIRARFLHRRVARALAELHGSGSPEWSGQIASHYEFAGMAEHAIEHLLLAASSARQRFAYGEAAVLLRRALSLRSNLTESAKGSEQEVDLLLLLGSVLVAIEGYSAPEVGLTYERALVIARRLRGNGFFASLSGLWVFHAVRGEVERSRQDALEFLRGAAEEATPGLNLAANFLLGCSLSHLGQFENAEAHLMLALEARSGSSDSVLEVFGGPDVRAFCRAYLSHVAFHRAVRDDDGRADAFISEAIETAEQMRHPFIQAIALNYAAILQALKADSCAALSLGTRAISVCSENGFTYYLAMAQVITGWALGEEGKPVDGLQLIHTGLGTMRELDSELRLPYYHALLAQTHGLAGSYGKASASISTGFAFAGKNGEEWTVPELYRVQGELLALEGKLEAAMTSYGRGLEAALHCGSRSCERRLTSLIQRTMEQLSIERS